MREAGTRGGTASLGAGQLASGKALLEEVQATQAALEADPTTATGELRKQYQALQRRLTQLPQSGLVTVSPDPLRLQLQGELTGVESKIADRVPLVAQAIRERNTSLTEIARALRPGSALVDFVHYHRFDFGARSNGWREARYAVYLTFPVATNSTNVTVERLDLGEAQPIDRAIGVILRRMSAGQYRAKDIESATESLSQMVYASLAQYLDNVSHLLISPDGQLSRLPFEILRHRGKLLIEEKTISYLGSGREVIRLAARNRTNSASASLVVGNPDFDLDLAAVGPALSQDGMKSNLWSGSVALAAGGRVSRSYRGGSFQPLPKAAEEARFVAARLGSNCVLRLGGNARESEVKSVQSPRVLHLATHGFFLSDQEMKGMSSIPDGLVLDRGRAGPSADDWESPLLRCGLALAGANHARQATNAVEDGLLTGQEAALLNLQGTELVILSACDTGAGEVKIGEGVMSLRRAFRIAGAETVIASHWPVSDLATRLLMTEFIRRWRAGEPRAKAWHEAQLSLLRSKDLSNPYFWAAFTLTGQWE